MVAAASPTLVIEQAAAFHDVDHLELDQLPPALITEWGHCNARHHNLAIQCDPDWFLTYTPSQRPQLHVFLMRSGAQVVGVVPFRAVASPLLICIGGRPVLRMPLRRLSLQGSRLSIPEDESAYDALFSSLAEVDGGFQALRFESIPVASTLWTYLETSRELQRHWRFYNPDPPTAHALIRMPESFDEYMSKFTSKTRTNRYREIKKLRQRGKLELLRYQTAEEVDTFLDGAVAISQSTYQYRLMGTGLRSREALQYRLSVAAQLGWMRSYLLALDGQPLSFMLGYQHRGRYYYDEVGYDPAWAEFSVGTVLHLLVLQDLFAHHRPEVFDFGAHRPHKQYFANDGYLEGHPLLLRRAAYPRAVEALDRVCRVVSRTGARSLEKLALKPRVRKLLRS